MEEELIRIIEVWVSTIISVSYCYYIPPRIKAGVLRLVFVLPVCVEFLVLPMLLSNSVFIFSTTFFLTGMGNLKLILFAFDKGPLFPLPLNLFQFICFTCFPIKKLQQTPKSETRFPKWVFFVIKVSLFGVLLHLRDSKTSLPSILLLGVYPLHAYLILDISLTVLKFLLGVALGCDLEPMFNEPYLATSLQDFWGRRWSPMVSSILRSGVYAPMRSVSKNNHNYSYLAMFMGVFTTFFFSGLFHELLFFYITRVIPSGEITLFYVLHGVCTAAEVAVKRTDFGRRWALRPVVSWLLTMAFLILTSNWLYFPQITRGKIRE